MKGSFYFRSIILCLLAWISLASCSRSSVLLSTTYPSQTTPEPENIMPSLEAPTERGGDPASAEGEYAVVWIPEGEVFQIRQPAGIAGVVMESMPFDTHGIYLTGNRSMLGSSPWVEIISSNNKIGWVKSWNLTEYKSAHEFCRDDRIPAMIAEFHRIILDTQRETLSKLISPEHGLTIRLNWYGPDVHFPREDAGDVLFSSEELFWGEMEDSGLSVFGSFEKIILPKIQDVFTQEPSVTCNALQYGSTSREAIYPSEFRNINYYAFFRPALEGGNEFDWRTWVIGIEYVHGEPYIAIVIHYSSEL